LLSVKLFEKKKKSEERYKLSFRDTLILAAFNEGTCLISGFVIFSVIGFMAKTEGKKVSEVADSGK
jgi:hypothetical protein